LKKENIFILGNTFGQFLKNCIGYKSPGDGHCLLHSIITCWNSRHQQHNHITKETIISRVWDEVYDHSEEYIPFLIDGDLAKLVNATGTYVYRRIYNQEIGDIILSILPNALNITITVFDHQIQIPLGPVVVTSMQWFIGNMMQQP